MLKNKRIFIILIMFLFLFSSSVFAGTWNYDTSTLSQEDIEYIDSVTDNLYEYMQENNITKKHYFIFIYQDETFDITNTDMNFFIAFSNSPNFNGNSSFTSCDIICFEYHMGDIDFYNIVQSDYCNAYYGNLNILFTNFSGGDLISASENESFFVLAPPTGTKGVQVVEIQTLTQIPQSIVGTMKTIIPVGLAVLSIFLVIYLIRLVILRQM